MRAHAKYLLYVLRHKWFVLLEGRRLGVSRLQLVAHDWQKFTPAEWGPYVRTFYGPKESPRRADGGYDPNAVSEAFDRAWLHHQKVGGKHHWQYWVLPLDDGGLRALAMPDRFRREMLADWRGAGRALGTPDTRGWYAVNCDKMILHPTTRAWVERVLGATNTEGAAVARFRTKPIVIEAIRFTGENVPEIKAFVGHAVGGVMDPLGKGPILWIRTLEGEMMAGVGDWLIRDAQGELHPCTSQMFDATYEAVDAA